MPGHKGIVLAKSEDVVQVLVEVIEEYGRAQCIRSDNGSQFVAQKVTEAFLKSQIDIISITPGSPRWLCHLIMLL